jgi:hypothetical protein
VFYAAQFPIIALNTLKSRHLTEDLQNNKITEATCELEHSLERSRISNISTVHSNIGYLFVSIINLSVLLPLANNPRVNNYTIVLVSIFLLLGYYITLDLDEAFSVDKRLLDSAWGLVVCIPKPSPWSPLTSGTKSFHDRMASTLRCF